MSALALGFHIGVEWKSRHLKKTESEERRHVFAKLKGYEKLDGESERTLHGYVLEHTNEHPILAELRQVTMQHTRSIMMAAPEECRLLAQLVQLIGARKCIEIGVYTGYNTLSVALALPDDGKVVGCDVSTDYTNIGKPFWEKAGVAHKIDLQIQPALNTLADLIAAGESDTFDFIFIDADKVNYPKYYEKSVQLLRRGGIIAVDNVLWSGYVIDDSKQDEETVAIRAVADRIRDDDRVDSSFLSISDGLQLAVKL